MKNMIFLVLVLAAVLISMPVFAAQVESAAGVLTIGGGNDINGNATDELSIGLSSQVSAVYENGGVANPQWFAIAASHLGGNQVYGTASDITNLYRLDTPKTPGEQADWAGMPADPDSSNEWQGDVWEIM